MSEKKDSPPVTTLAVERNTAEKVRVLANKNGEKIKAVTTALLEYALERGKIHKAKLEIV